MTPGVPRAIINKFVTGPGGLPSVAYLAATAEGYAWQPRRAAAYIFPEYFRTESCRLGEKCETHAECVAAVLGGQPAVPANDATLGERIAASAPASSTPLKARAHKAIGDRLAVERPRVASLREPIDPAEVFERLEKRKEA